MKQSPVGEYRMSNCAVAETSDPQSDPKQIIPDPQHCSWRLLSSLSQLLGSKVLQNAENAVSSSIPDYLFSSCQATTITVLRLTACLHSKICLVTHLLCILQASILDGHESLLSTQSIRNTRGFQKRQQRELIFWPSQSLLEWTESIYKFFEFGPLLTEVRCLRRMRLFPFRAFSATLILIAHLLLQCLILLCPFP